jgi:hypothetical protein
MDPITTSVVAALAVVAHETVKDGYAALKAAIQHRFGKKSDVADALEALEKKPTSESRRATLKEDVKASGTRIWCSWPKRWLPSSTRFSRAMRSARVQFRSTNAPAMMRSRSASLITRSGCIGVAREYADRRRRRHSGW